MIRTTLVTGLTTLSGTMLAGTLMLGNPLPNNATPAAAAAPQAPQTTLIERAAPARGGFGERLRDAGRRDPVQRIQRSLIRKTAEQTGLSIADITTQLQSGSTLAEIAATNGSSSDDVVNAVLDETRILMGSAVERGRMTEEEVEQAVARIEQQANEIMQATDLGDKIETATEQQMERMSRIVLVSGASDVTGLFPRTITVRLMDGETLADIVTDEGFTTDEVIAAALENAQERLDRMVERGLLSQAEADECLATIQQNVNEMINQPQLGR